MKPIILFDYGGVIAHKTSKEAEHTLCKALKSDVENVWKVLGEKSKFGSLYRKGSISTVDFWKSIAIELGIDYGLIDHNYLAEAWMSTYVPDEKMINLLRELKRNCYIGILSNIDEGRSNILKRLELFSLLDYYFPSYKFMETKYSELLWSRVDEFIKKNVSNAGEIIYVDDREKHVASANKVGWQSIQFHSIDALSLYFSNKNFL
jgi:FMN phosphatase YigB (HAD superfamily)